MAIWMKTLAGIFVVGLLGQPVQLPADETPAETLEKGVYQEETTGNLEEAIKLYRQVLKETQKTKSLRAQAQFRLGRCLKKLGKTQEAEKALQELIKQYPDEKQLVEQAKKLLPGEIQLGKAPWKAGEYTTLTIKLPGGSPVGVVGLSVTEKKQNGNPVWDFQIRRHIAGTTNEGVSQVIVDQKTNRPLSTVWRHTLLGDATSEWTDRKIHIMTTHPDKKPEDKTVTFDPPAYSNDQLMYGFRQLPLKVGYEVNVPVRVAFSGGNPVGIEMSVKKKEKIETGMGTFECFRVETNIGQTFWFTDTPEKQIAQIDAGGVVTVLTSVTDGKAEVLTNEPLGFSVTKPQGWFHYELNSRNERTSGRFRLVAPKDLVSVTLHVRNKSLLEPEERMSLDSWADETISIAKDSFKKANPREGGRKQIRMAGTDALQLIVDHEGSGRQMATITTMAFVGDKAVEFVVTGEAEAVKTMEKTWETLRSSVKVK